MTPEQKKDALHYDIEALKKHIEKRRANIKVFEDAIVKELDGIVSDEQMITFLQEHKNDHSN